MTDSVTSAAIGGATVACSGTPSCTSTTTASDGTYTLTVAPGTYVITATQTGYATGTNSGVVVTTGNSTPESFSLVPNPGTISGKVTDSLTSAAIAGATVACTGTMPCTSTVTAGDGTYTLSGLTEGAYQVTASANGYSPETVNPINVGPGGTPTQNFALGPLPGQITGTVTKSDGITPISGANVACTGTPACTGTATASNGTYTLSGLAEGTYSVNRFRDRLHAADRSRHRDARCNNESELLAGGKQRKPEGGRDLWLPQYDAGHNFDGNDRDSHRERRSSRGHDQGSEQPSVCGDWGERQLNRTQRVVTGHEHAQRSALSRLSTTLRT